MLSCISLTKKFNDLIAVDQLTLDLKPGEIFGFIGPNGAGKTTTIKLCTGLLKPTSGSVVIDGIDINKNPREAKKRIGYISDQPYVYPLLTGMEFLRFMGDIYRVSAEYRKKRIPELIELFESGDYIHDLIESYSHGMRQKLVLMSVLLHEPKIIFLDEPMVGFDPKTARLVKRIFEELSKKNVVIFMSTHTLELAEKICHRIGIIHAGRMIAIGPIDELKTRAQKQGSLEDIFLEITGGTEYYELLKYL